MVAFKKANPRVEILADEGFTVAFEKSIPVVNELVDSPLLGVWRSDVIESEWGELILEIRFKPNGVFYQGMLAAEIDQETEEQEGFTVDGRFSVQDDLLEMTIQEKTVKQKFKIENDILALKSEGEKIRYTRVAE